ncbi:MAG: hypothetical protein E2O72_07535 [Candidatus Dadabacteria bacterium]|nr:MAG: hypothetical protein E2O72_07535 [Candidatus Dadabacteria bacterium]
MTKMNEQAVEAIDFLMGFLIIEKFKIKSVSQIDIEKLKRFKYYPLFKELTELKKVIRVNGRK